MIVWYILGWRTLLYTVLTAESICRKYEFVQLVEMLPGFEVTGITIFDCSHHVYLLI